MTKITEDIVRQLAQDRIDERCPGCFLVNVQVDSMNHILVEVDHESRGVSIEECVWISRNVEHNLDREENDFELEVTSAGLDRPLRVWKQYEKNVGRELHIRMNDGTELKGLVLKAEEGKITVLPQAKGKKKKDETPEELVIDTTEIKEAKVIISFK